ncbi:response regulator [Gracilibacillus salinarum]|uniref:Response regulator n=1 Tax=Gracilibacillus salinarum TaxID=2932255 RepID=A0ABY4GHP6_9BACI|nr:response regulator [Gracilibacillus salinarum]UOQ83510.1 response regulator [Gracilibacillus salinarum]
MAHVLIVDDEKLIREGIHAMLNRLLPGHQCLLADNGKTALDVVESQKIDLIISDIKMPVMDGMDFARELVSKNYQIPFIFLTGLEEFTLVQQAIKYRAIDYILKPINGEELKTIVHSCLDFSVYLEGKEIPETTRSSFEQFEFRIHNSLEALDKQAIETLILEIYEEMEDKRILCHELQRIINSFAIKRNISGVDYLFQNQPVNAMQAVQITHQLMDTLQANTKEETIIDIAKRYIKDNLHKPPTLVEVSDAVHLNPNYFSDYFKEKTGEAFSKYVSRLRMEKAKALLKDTRIKIKDVAQQCGYHDAQNFRDKFKQVIGVSPNQYRKTQKLR